MKKALSIILAVVMVVAMIPMAALSAFATTDATEIDTWAELVAIGLDTDGGNYILTADLAPTAEELSSFATIALLNINLNGNGKKITGFVGENALFTMTASGGNTVTVENLTVGADTEEYSSVAVLMKNVPEGTECTVRNVTVNAKKVAGTAEQGVSALVAAAKGKLTVENCVNNAEVDGLSRTGAFVGNYTGVDLTVKGCVNNAKITSNDKHYVGGIVGGTETGETATVTNSFVIENCVNYGEISGGGEVGGIVGGFLNNSTQSGTISIKNCKNYGDVFTTVLTSNWKTVGGVVGWYKTTDSILVDGFENRGDISGNGYTAGVIGSIDAKANVGQSITVNNVVNYGTVAGNGNNVAVGLVTSHTWTKLNIPMTVNNVVNYGVITSEKNRDAGLIAGTFQSNTTLTVNGIANFGTVKSLGNVAVGIGFLNGATSITFKNALNMGTVDGSAKRGSVVFANGEHSETEFVIENVINVGTISSAWTAGPILGLTKKATSLTLKNVVNAGAFNTGSGYAIGDYGTVASNLITVTNAAYTHTVTEGCDNGLGAPVTLAEALTKINAIEGFTFGKFKWADEAQTTLVQATPDAIGCQLSAVENGKLSVRFVATIKNTLMYKEVGFNVATNGGAATKLDCRNVYSTLAATDKSGATIKYTAEEFGGSFIYALTVEDVPAVGTVTFTVSPYAVDMDNTTTYTGSVYTVTLVDGVVTSIVEA